MANIGDTIGGGVLFYSGATSGLVASSVDIPFFWGGRDVHGVTLQHPYDAILSPGDGPGHRWWRTRRIRPAPTNWCCPGRRDGGRRRRTGRPRPARYGGCTWSSDGPCEPCGVLGGSCRRPLNPVDDLLPEMPAVLAAMSLTFGASTSDHHLGA